VATRIGGGRGRARGRFCPEEDRIHIHVIHADGEAKIWLEPEVELHFSYGLSSKQEKSNYCKSKRMP
jgi:hypothetical protein